MSGFTPKMARRLCVVTIVGFLVLTGVLIAYRNVDEDTLFEQIGPTVIEGDSQLTSKNGVIDGDGTASSPYIIDGWRFETAPVIGLWIRNTTAHIVVSNVSFKGDGAYGIVLDNVKNCTIRDSTIMGSEGGGVLVRFPGKAADSNIRIVNNLVGYCGDGVEAINATDLEISNNTFVRMMEPAITLRYCDEVMISDSRMFDFAMLETAATHSGIFVDQCRGVFVDTALMDALRSSSWTIPNDFEGISVFDSDDVSVLDCTFEYSYGGGAIRVTRCSNILVGGGAMRLSGQGGIMLDWSENCTIDSCRFQGYHGTVHGVSMVNLTGASVTASTFDRCDLYARDCERLTVDGNRLVSGDFSTWSGYYRGAAGIMAVSVHNASIRGNMVLGCGGTSIYLYTSSHIVVADNVVADAMPESYFDGIGLTAIDVLNLSVTGNRFGDNMKGFEQYYNGEIHLRHCDGALITDNRMLNDSLYIHDSDSPNIRNNSFSGPRRASVWTVENGSFYGNNLVDGYNLDLREVVGMALDGGYPSGGNYWWNHSGPDEFSGPDQDVPGSDGLVDVPLLVSGLSDEYPLATPAVFENRLAPYTVPILWGNNWNQEWYVSNITVTLAAYDPECAQVSTHFRIDGGQWQNYGNSFNATASGKHLLEFYSEDASGLEENTSAKRLWIDQDRPSVRIVKPAPNGTIPGREAMVQLETSDETSGVEMLTWSYQWGWGGYLTKPELEIGGSSINERVYSIVVIDEAGNNGYCMSTYTFDTDIMSTSGPYGWWYVSGTFLDFALIGAALTFFLYWYIFTHPPKMWVPPTSGSGVPKGPQTKEDLEDGYPKYIRKI